MGLTEKFMFGIVFPLMFCSIGGIFARQGYSYFKTKRDKKRRCLSQTYGKIVSISSMKTQRRRAYIDGYKEDTVSSVACLILGSIAVLCGLFVGLVVWLR